MTEQHDFAMRFERTFVEMIFSELDRRGITKREMARYVFKDRASPDRVVQAIQKGSYPAKGGKPQRFTLAESYRVAEFLRLDYVALVAAVIGETLRSGGTFSNRLKLPGSQSPGEQDE